MIELGYNIASVALCLVLVYVMDKITDAPDLVLKAEPISGKPVPFFVYYTSVKLMNDYLMDPGALEKKYLPSSGRSASIYSGVSQTVYTPTQNSALTS